MIITHISKPYYILVWDDRGPALVQFNNLTEYEDYINSDHNPERKVKFDLVKEELIRERMIL